MNVGDLKKYKDGCYSALSRDLTEFEKNFLYIASGILAFSTTFIKDIIKISDVVMLPLLFASWVCIIIAIGLMMGTFLKSANASDNLWNVVDNFQVQNTLFEDATPLTSEQWLAVKSDVTKILSKSKAQLKRMRAWAVKSFLLGIFLFSLFISWNLSTQRKTNIDEKSNLAKSDSIKLNKNEQINPTKTIPTAKP